MTSLLFIEDDDSIRLALRLALEDEGYEVREADDGRSGLQSFAREEPDLVLLDLRLPDISGFEVCRTLRKSSIVPIIIVTAQTDTYDLVAGLEAGADDYVMKPVDPMVLLARVRALLRRGAAPVPAVLAIADLRLDPATREVTRGNKRIDLTPKEYALLEFLLRRRDQVLSRAMLAQHVWGVNYDTFTNVIDVYVNYLRKKIDSDFEPKLIHTVRGVGYVLKEEPSAP